MCKTGKGGLRRSWEILTLDILDLAGTPRGEALWAFLNEKDSLIRLETATYLRRPALEGVQEQLLERFGPEIKGWRWKQMMGG